MDAEMARRYDGALTVMFALLAAWGVYWPITPAAHPKASTVRQAAVVGQVLVTAALALWFWRRAGRASARALRATRHGRPPG